MPSIVYKEWLPDQPDLGNPGLLRAENALPLDSGFAPFRPIDTAFVTTVGSNAKVFDSFLSSGLTKGAERVYSYADQFYVGGTPLGGASTATPGNVAFAQYDNLVLAVMDQQPALKHTIGSTSTVSSLAASGTAPPAQAIGVIGQFVVIGGLGTAGSTAARLNAIKWSGVDAPTSWPDANSETAIAQQAGEQDLPTLYGEVQAIHGGDQHGIVFQKRAITRMTYVGPPVVFQFDTISANEGCFFTRGHLRVGNISYFVSEQGLCRTDGVTVDHIGAGIVDREYFDSAPTDSQIGDDAENDLIYFAYGVSSSLLTQILIFNPKNRRWSKASQNLTSLVNGAVSDAYASPMRGFTTAGGQAVVGRFNATAGAAVLESGEMELNEGGRAYIDAVKPHIESSGTAPSVTVAIGYRDSLATTPSYTSETSANSRTGFANFRVDAKYARIRTTVTGNFDKATGVEFNAVPSGKA